MRLYDLDIRQKKRYEINGIYDVRHKVVDMRKTYWKQECMNKQKIVISMPGYIKALYDPICGCSDATLFMYVSDKEEADHLISLLNSNVYQFIINNYRELTGLNNHKNINLLTILPPYKDINEYFNFSEKEIILLENFNKKKDEDDCKSIVLDISVKSSKSPSITIPKKSNEDAILCGAFLKKKGETCKNKANSDCNGRCRKHYVIVI